MANEGIKGRKGATGQWVTVRRADGKASSKVTFGSVTVSGVKPSAAAVRTNVERSTRALERITSRLAKPGVVLRSKKGVPQFSAAEGEPGVFIRRLNGRVERGRLVDGEFKVLG